MQNAAAIIKRDTYRKMCRCIYLKLMFIRLANDDIGE